MKDEEIQEQKPEEVIAPETTETEDGGIEVNLEEEGKPQEEVKQEEKKVVPPVESKEKKLENQLGYTQRKLAKLEQEILSMRQTPPPVREEVISTPTDEIDKLAQSDWKAAVRKLGAEEAQRILREDRDKLRQQTQLTETQLSIEKNAQTALERHPELNEEGSEKTQIWFDILNANPRWRNSPDGPLLTMYKMEEELRKKGYDIDGEVTKKVSTEKERFIRANSTALPSSRKTAPTNKITLTKEQRDFCDSNEMKYEDYARSLQQGEMGVTL